MSWIAKTLHVSPTGRAKPRGNVTRRSLNVRGVKYPKYKGSDRPLDAERMCHPVALTPTPRHPGCMTNSAQYNVSMWDEYDWAAFMRGAGLWDAPEPGEWRVVEPITGEILGWASCSDALSYRNAAARKGATLEVYDNV